MSNPDCEAHRTTSDSHYDVIPGEDPLDRLVRLGLAVRDCRLCKLHAEGKLVPSHNGSPRCESGSISSGGNKSHCSCTACF